MPVTVKVLTTVLPPTLPIMVRIPLFVVVAEADHVSYQAVCVLPAASRLSMNIVVTEAIAALLYEIAPGPGSASVVLVLNEYFVPPLSPVVPRVPCTPCKP